MATQIAGGTTPDVFAMSGSYPSEYATRGVLLDLDKVKEQIDTSKFAEGTVDLGKIDGKQYTITAGVNCHVHGHRPESLRSRRRGTAGR